MTGRCEPPLAPGAVIGMLGGGQLGRMAALAAAAFGYRVHGFCPDADSPLSQVCGRMTHAAYDDETALAAFARSVDVVSYEFENIPLDTARYLAERVPVRPSPAVLAVCQDRWSEKSFLRDLAIATAPFARADDAGGLAAAIARIGRPAVAKTRRLGYDGKGQAMLPAEGDLADADDAARRTWERLGGAPAIVEGFVAFDREVSVITARGADGTVVSFPPVENRHADHILKTTLAPAALPAPVAAAALEIAGRIAEALDLVGLVAVEMFVAGDTLLVNELAPRPHNSGHWTLDACRTSQFDQFIRAIAGLPLAPVGRFADAVMDNLLGAEIDRWPALVADPACRLHHYGKGVAKPGRKMGHVTRLTGWVDAGQSAEAAAGGPSIGVKTAPNLKHLV